jgi:uncharacterized protein
MLSPVRDVPQRQRFELDTAGLIAFANYKRDGNTLTIMHTEVPLPLRGKGIGSDLARGLLTIARAEGLSVVPLCPFIATYIARHPEYADLLH